MVFVKDDYNGHQYARISKTRADLAPCVAVTVSRSRSVWIGSKRCSRRRWKLPLHGGDGFPLVAIVDGQFVVPDAFFGNSAGEPLRIDVGIER